MNRLTLYFICFFLLCLSLLTACDDTARGQEVERVGMLIENSINDQSWGNKGYRGLLEIQEELNAEVFFKEEVQTQQQVNIAVEEFANKGIQVIIGHSSIYGEYFNRIHASYPSIEFIYVNGGYSADNLISLNFNSLAMGFFAGMVAGDITETDKVGIIAAYEWQPEIEGFYEGVRFQNSEAGVEIRYVNSWDEQDIAVDHYQDMLEENMDVIYPAGDAFSIPVVEAAQTDGIYSIGYVNDQQDIGGNSVLTSTIQHIDKLYVYALEKLHSNELEGGIYNFGFQEEVITMGPYSDYVPFRLKSKLDNAVEEYKETGLLPHQLNNSGY